MNKTSFTAILVTAAITAGASASAVNATALTVGTSGPFVVGDYGVTGLNDLTWFTFTLDATTSIDIDFDRTSAPPDLIASLYSGDIDGFDASGFGAHSNVIVSDFGPLTYIEWQDDTHDDAFGGPFGDPQFTNTLDAGTYSIVVSALQGAGGEFTVTSNVAPTPGVLAALGLAGLMGTRRRR
jgi:MYXO-CTERM domain-containing protein